MDIHTLADAQITTGTRVVLRAGLNVPVDETGKPTDEFRLRQALGTIEYLADKGARTVIIGHLGRKGESMKHVAEALQKLTTKTKITFFDGSPAEAAGETVKNGQCLILENIRRQEGEEKNDPEFAEQIAALGELFVNDAFADSHRAHASIVGVGKLLPAYAGLLVEKEITNLSRALMPVPGSVAVVGGAKFETKEPLIMRLINLYEHVVIGGALGNDFLKARGVDVAKSMVSSVAVPPEIANDPRILLPIDGIFQAGDLTRMARFEELAPHERILDAGAETIAAWNNLISRATFILWNGTLGVCEQGFVEGTNALARAISAHCKKTGAHAIVGGGDTIAALAHFSFDQEKIFCSTGGGAMLQFLADGTLPGINILKK